MAFPLHLAWIDCETSGLPVGNDWSGVSVLEVALIVTDLNLTPLVGFTEVVAMTVKAAAEIRANPEVRQMHVDSGLLKDSVTAAKSAAPQSVEMVESEMVKILSEIAGPGEFIIAGSGVAAFDHPLIKGLMPEVAPFLAYYSLDIGIVRRAAKILSGRDLVYPNTSSYGTTKVHRALADIKAHLTEARSFQTFYRGEHSA